jgi:hypothetical protein
MGIFVATAPRAISTVPPQPVPRDRTTSLVNAWWLDHVLSPGLVEREPAPLFVHARVGRFHAKACSATCCLFVHARVGRAPRLYRARVTAQEASAILKLLLRARHRCERASNEWGEKPDKSAGHSDIV